MLVMSAALPSNHSFTLQLTYPNDAGVSARIADTIGRHGGDLRTIRVVESRAQRTTRGLNVRARDEKHVEEIVAAVSSLEQVQVVKVSDPVFQLHLGGKIGVRSKVPIASREVLAMAYTPGVARVSSAIAEDRTKVWALTAKSNSVAVVSDGTAVLGLGDVGPEAAMPVMEGKAMLFKEFANIDAYPICLRTKDPFEIVETVSNLSVGFGGINLEDISAPRCFEIEYKLQQRLDIPVFHDGQHGTAVVVLAGLLNALKLTGRKLATTRIVICGAGAAGTALTRMLLRCGVRDLVVCDRHGILHERRPGDLNETKLWLARQTNPRHLHGGLGDALKGAHVFIGVSKPGLLTAALLKRMAAKPIVFALANPLPEIMPEEAATVARIVATGRSDYPNQINNVLAFPGIFRGALDARAAQITEAMKLAAARAIASCVSPHELAPDHIVPSVFNQAVVQRVAAAVKKAYLRTKPAPVAKQWGAAFMPPHQRSLEASG
jgi:malate dehydrogenase (oxaloacetate-decarboxylating)